MKTSALLLALTLLVAASPALAGGADAAQTLFDRGVAHLEAGRYDRACPDIEESYKLDPRPGTLFTLALCEEKGGKLASALRHYDRYLAEYGALSPEKKAKQGDREQVSRASRAALQNQVPELTMALPPNAPPGTRVTRDGAVVDAPELGVPVRVDPGEHVVVTQAPGAQPSTVRVTLGPGDRKSLALVVFAIVPVGSAAVAPPPADAPAAAPRPSWRLITGSTFIGAGVVAMVTGAVSSAQVASAQAAVDVYSKMTPEPPTFDFCSDATAQKLNLTSACARGKTFSTLQYVMYPVGAALIGAGVVLVVMHALAPRAKASSFILAPSVGARFTGLDASLPF